MRIVSLVAAAALAACSPRMVRWGELNDDAVAAVVRDMAALRGLPPKRPIRFRLVGVERLRADFARDVEQDADSGQMARRKRYWATVGLVPWELDLRAHYRDLYARLPAGYYNDEEGGVRVVARNSLRSELTELAGLLTWRDKTVGETVAHEVVHALQDQHFGLEALSAGEGSDGRCAARALVEGDAFLAAYRYDRPLVFGHVEDMARVIERAYGAQRGGAPPSWVEEVSLFPYVHGVRFAAALHAEGGWGAVNAAYLAPPSTTAEVLHPERYLRRTAPPAAIDLSEARTALAAPDAGGWQAEVEEPLGELAVRYLLDGPLARRDAAEVAAAWRGDRALVAMGPGGGTALVWVTRWATAEAGRRFAKGYRARMERMERRAVRVAERGQVVTVVAGLDGDLAGRVEALALAGVARSGRAAPSPPPRPEFVAGPERAERPAQALPALDVQGYDAGPTWRIEAGDARLRLGGGIEYRAGEPGSGSGSGHRLPRANVALTGELEQVMRLSFGLTAELSPHPDEPTWRPAPAGPGASAAAGAPALGGGTPLQDAWLGMSVASGGVGDLGRFTFGRRVGPLVLEAGDALPLATRSLPFDRLLPVRDVGFVYEVDYSWAGVPAGVAVALGEDLSGARLSIFGPRRAAPFPRLEGGLAYALRQPSGDGGAPLRAAAYALGDLAARWRGLALRALGVWVEPDAGEAGRPQHAWSALALVQPLPDFLDVVARFDRLSVRDRILPFGEQTRLTAGVNLHYLAGRMLIGFEAERTEDAAPGVPPTEVARLRVALNY